MNHGGLLHGQMEIIFYCRYSSLDLRRRSSTISAGQNVAILLVIDRTSRLFLFPVEYLNRLALLVLLHAFIVITNFALCYWCRWASRSYFPQRFPALRKGWIGYILF